ncbi:MAG: hypothetical protein LKF74_05030, partial [Megasphaera sp.]|nr:hypothetical protein [Megasphaera sp.]MCH4217904.1 hypothetical protein [Megasphaera sp.]
MKMYKKHAAKITLAAALMMTALCGSTAVQAADNQAKPPMEQKQILPPGNTIPNAMASDQKDTAKTNG